MTNPWDTEIAIDLDRVAWLIARDLPELAGQALRVVGEGWDNLAVRVGDAYVLRLARRALAAEILARECQWVGAVTRELGVLTSAPLRFLPPTADHPFPYALHPWIDGETGCRADVDFAALAEQLGAVLRRLHALPVPADAPPDVLGRGDPLKRGRRAVARLAEIGVTPDVAGWREVAREDEPRVWVHGDLYGRHLVFRDRQLAGIIDWGDIHAGSREADLAVVWSFLPPEVRGAFFAAYGEVDEDTRVRARWIALDYAGALIPYGRAVGDAAAERLGWTALARATG